MTYFPDTTSTTQGLSLWCFNIVRGEILTFPDTRTHYSGVIPMVFQKWSLRRPGPPRASGPPGRVATRYFRCAYTTHPRPRKRRNRRAIIDNARLLATCPPLIVTLETRGVKDETPTLLHAVKSVGSATLVVPSETRRTEPTARPPVAVAGLRR